MKKLILKEKNKILGEITLSENKEFYIGRNPDSDIVLESTRAVSRKHFKISFTDGIFKLEALSQFAKLSNPDGNDKEISISENCEIISKPFTLIFVGFEENTPKRVSTELLGSNNSDTEYIPAEDDEVTSAGVGFYKAQLIATYSTGEKETFTLENNSKWVAGRDPHCDIYLRDDHVSRRHFEISRNEDESFSITELGSSNGSVIDNNKLITHQITNIHSGEIIVISKVSVEFIVLDDNFEDIEKDIDENILNFPAITNDIDNNQQGFDPSLFFENTEQGGVILEPQIVDKKKKLIRYAILALIPIIIWGLFGGNDKKINKTSSSSSNLKLKAEDLEMIKDALSLAQSHFNKGSFSLCLSEISKVHNIIPKYQNSRELDNYCQIGLEQARVAEDKERRQKEKIITERKISKIVAVCKERLNSFNTVEQLNVCLNEAIELDPANLSIEELRTIITIRQQNNEDKLKLASQRRIRIQNGKNKYYKAINLYKKGKLRKSIYAFKTYLNGRYTELPTQNKKATRKLASVKKELNTKIKTLLLESKNYLDKGNYKASYEAAVKAQKEDPKNKEANEYKKKVRRRLSLDMKLIFENSIIEENYGNISAAKEYWQEILRRDFKNGSSFYRKAKKRLKKYGL